MSSVYIQYLVVRKTLKMTLNKPATGFVCHLTAPKSWGGAMARAARPFLRDPENPINDKVFRDKKELKVFWDKQGLTYVDDKQFELDYGIVVSELEIVNVSHT